MKLTDFTIYKYHFPLAKPITVGKLRLEYRDGLLVRLTDDANNIAWGEAAPLQGFSRESLDEITGQLFQLKSLLVDTTLPESITQVGAFDGWLGSTSPAPSVRCGLETAVLRLVATGCKQPMRCLLSDNTADLIVVNALLAGQPDEIVSTASQLHDEGFTAFKLKVGHRPFDEDIQLVTRVRQAVGNKATLRLDANRAWSIDEATTFAAGVAIHNIEYIEEPVYDFLGILQLTNKGQFPLPVALDESLTTMTPGVLSSFQGIKALILKPMLLGFDRARQFAFHAKQSGLLSIVSSSFESSVGIAALAELAAGLNRPEHSRVAVGLDTLRLLGNDIVEQPLQIKRGEINLAEIETAAIQPVVDDLTELTDA